MKLSDHIDEKADFSRDPWRLRHFVVTWDHREQPPLEEINEALTCLARDCQLIMVETKSDQYALVVAPSGTTQEAADAAYAAFEEMVHRA